MREARSQEAQPAPKARARAVDLPAKLPCPSEASPAHADPAADAHAPRSSALSLARKLATRTPLSPAELDIVDGLYDETRTVASGRDIITEGYKYDTLLLLVDGIAIRYRVLRDGRRQILNVVLPGDFIGFPACFFDSALYSITTLCSSKVALMPFSRLFQIFRDHPRIGAAMFWLLSCEAAMYAERVIAIGQRSALERLSHFLLELLTRMQVIGLAEEWSFNLPLTQEQIGDILGLTGVHISRTMRQLRDDGLIIVTGQKVTIANFPTLAALADFERTYLSHFRMSDTLFAEMVSRSAQGGRELD
jgi:CRP-like cAMP-binding protein